MKDTIICTVSRDVQEVRDAISELTGFMTAPELVYTGAMKIHGCIGCNDCWLKTPGICPIKDDYEQIFIRMLQSGRVIFIAETKYGFVSYRMKNLLDRILPMLTMFIKFKNGQMRHYRRYKSCPDMGLLFTGDADPDYLNRWMERVTLNFHSQSLGAYEIGDRKELYHALGNR